MAKKACQPFGANIFSNNNRKRCEKYVRSIQRKLDKAVANNDKKFVGMFTFCPNGQEPSKSLRYTT